VIAVLADLQGSAHSRREPDCQVFVDKLFSLRHAEALPRCTRVVQVAPATVITPMARDLLKLRGITIRLESLNEARSVSLRGEWAFAITSDMGTVHALRRALLDDSRPWTELDPALERVAEWVIAGAGRGAMLITEEGALTVWRSCQVPGVRAASAVEPADVHHAVRSLGLNLLVIEPAGKSISWMKQLGNAFRHSGSPVIPDDLLPGGCQ
jgi:hypothetical protein